MIGPTKYTPKEQIANAFSHLIGVVLSIYGTLVLAANSKTMIQDIGAAVFGISLFFLFLSSVFYHTVREERAVKFFQKIDHSAIYVLIAGTYTPGLLFTIKFPLSVIFLAIIWALAITGILLTCVSIKSKKISTGLYLFLGWISVFFVKHVWAVSHLVVWLLLAGGVIYSIGSVFYMMKFRFTHFIWHLCVLAGASTHYFAILELMKL